MFWSPSTIRSTAGNNGQAFANAVPNDYPGVALHAGRAGPVVVPQPIAAVVNNRHDTEAAKMAKAQRYATNGDSYIEPPTAGRRPETPSQYTPMMSSFSLPLVDWSVKRFTCRWWLDC